MVISSRPSSPYLSQQFPTDGGLACNKTADRRTAAAQLVHMVLLWEGAILWQFRNRETSVASNVGVPVGTSVANNGGVTVGTNVANNRGVPVSTSVANNGGLPVSTSVSNNRGVPVSTSTNANSTHLHLSHSPTHMCQGLTAAEQKQKSHVLQLCAWWLASTVAKILPRKHN